MSEVKIKVSLQDEATDRFGDMEKRIEQFGSRVQKDFGVAADASKKFAIALAGAGTAVVGGIAIAVKAAADAEVSVAKFNATLATMGEKGLKAKDAILQAAAASTRLGFDDEDAALSVARLYQRTGDLTESMRLNALAMDLARAKSMDLGQASELIGQVLAGNGRVLKQYGIDIKETASPLEALTELQKRVAGQSAEYAKTFNGQLEILRVTFGNLLENIGGPFLEMLTAMMMRFNDLINAAGGADGIFRNLQKTFETVQPHFGLIAAAITGALLPAMLTTIGTLMNMWNQFSLASSALLPWIALATAAYYAYTTNFLGIRDSIDQFLEYLGPTFAQINAIIMEHGGIVGTVRDAWLIVQTESSALLEGISIRYRAWIQDTKNMYKSLWIDVQLAWYGTWNAIGDWFQTKLDSIMDMFMGWYNRISGWLNTILSSLGLVEQGVRDKQLASRSGSNRTSSTGRALGGMVEGRRGLDQIPTMLTAGEVVLNAAMQQNVAAAIDRPSGGGLTVVVTDNNFYGDDERLAERVGERIVKMVIPHLNFNSL